MGKVFFDTQQNFKNMTSMMKRPVHEKYVHIQSQIH